jgi:hypothetical protein
MSTEHEAHSCRWATPTLFLEWPYWLDALTWPWSCSPDGRLHLLSDSEKCQTCGRWIARKPGEEPATFDHQQAIVKD